MKSLRETQEQRDGQPSVFEILEAAVTSVQSIMKLQSAVWAMVMAAKDEALGN